MKKKKGDIDAEFDNLLTANGKELSVKRRIITKVEGFEKCFYKYKSQLTEEFIYEVSGRLWLFNMTQAAKQFQKELDDIKEAENAATKPTEQITIDFEDVIYTDGVYKKPRINGKRVGETVNN